MVGWEHHSITVITEGYRPIEKLIEKVWECTRITMPEYCRCWHEAIRRKSVPLAMQLSTYRTAFSEVLHQDRGNDYWEGLRMSLECIYWWWTDEKRRAYLSRHSWSWELRMNFYSYLLTRGCLPVPSPTSDPKMIWWVGTIGIEYRWFHDYIELRDSLDRMCCLMMAPYVSSRRFNGSRLQKRPNVMVMYDN